MKTIRPEVIYKVRHKPTGKWLARSFGTAPWSLVKRGGRVFTHPKYVKSMIEQKVNHSNLSESRMLRWGLGSLSDYEIVPFILLEDSAYIQSISSTPSLSD